VTRFGTFSLKMRFDGSSFGGTGTISQGNVAVVVLQEFPLTLLTLNFSSAGQGSMRATVRKNFSEVSAESTKKGAMEFVEQFKGQYNVCLTEYEDGPPCGYAMVIVKPDGSARATGHLSNGKPWSAGTNISEIGGVPIAVTSPKGSSVLIGELNLPYSDQAFGSVSGTIARMRSFGTQTLGASGSRFVKQQTVGQNVFGSTRTKAEFLIDSPALRQRLPGTQQRFVGTSGLVTGGPVVKQSSIMPISINGQNRVTQLRPAPPLVTLAIKNDGRFTGTFVPPSSGQFLHVSGLMASNLVHGFGVLTGGKTGYVLIGETVNADTQSGSSGVVVTVGGGVVTSPPSGSSYVFETSTISGGVNLNITPNPVIPGGIQFGGGDVISVIPITPSNPPTLDVTGATGVTGVVTTTGGTLTLNGGLSVNSGVTFNSSLSLNSGVTFNSSVAVPVTTTGGSLYFGGSVLPVGGGSFGFVDDGSYLSGLSIGYLGSLSSVSGSVSMEWAARDPIVASEWFRAIMISSQDSSELGFHCRLPSEPQNPQTPTSP
jgi:hypothetical protein